MGHFEHKETRAEKTAPEWLPIGVDCAELVNGWARREDIIAYVGPGAGGPTPAAFNPGLAEMEVNIEAACHENVTPDDVTGLAAPGSKGVRVREDNPGLVGALFHEAMHARHSLWNIPDLYKNNPQLIAEIVTNFEETRIEGLGMKHYPKMKQFLRASAIKLILTDMEEELAKLEVESMNALSMGLNAQLVLGRVDIGVLEPSDVSTLYGVLETIFGTDLLGKMRLIWLRAQAVRDDFNMDEMIALAHEWVDLMVENEVIPDPDKAGEPGDGDGDGDGESGEGFSPGSGGMEIPEELVKALMDALNEAADVADIEARGAIGEEQEQREWDEEVEKRNAEAAEEREHKSVASKVFGKGTGPSPGSRTSSTLVENRPPTGKERAAAVKVAQLLDLARYQERIVTPTSSVLPPGRLRSRAMVQAGAERARGAMIKAEPWRAKHRRHVEDPKLQIGVMVDISGSMMGAMAPMGVSAWVFTEAARRIDASVAQVYYGNSVFATLRPGEYQDTVRIYDAPDGTEKFDEAFKAMDGMVNFLHGSGARLLVIASDMYYTSGEERRAEYWIKRCVDAGVAVLIMGFGEMYHSENSNYAKLGATVVNDRLGPAESALVVGQAAAAAIEKASGRNER